MLRKKITKCMLVLLVLSLTAGTYSGTSYAQKETESVNNTIQEVLPLPDMI